MKNNTIEDIKEYAKDSQTKQEPTEQNYAEGVKVGWTLPAKWWNWLMNAFTKRFRETKATVDSMYEELVNLMWPLTPGENETNDQCKSRIHGSISELSERIDTNTSDITNLKSKTGVLSASLSSLATDVANNTENIKTNTADIATNTGNISANATAITNEAAARQTADSDLDSKISSLSSEVDTNTSAISNETAARQGADSDLDSKITNLIITVSANTENIAANATAITNEAAARQTADSDLDSKISSLSSEVDTNTSAISNETAARQGADSDLDSKITSLSNTVSANTSDITRNSRNIASNKDYLKRIKNSVDMHPFDFGAGTDIHTIDILLDPSDSTVGTEVRTPIHFIYSMHNNYNDIVVRLINNKDSWNSYDDVRWPSG